MSVRDTQRDTHSERGRGCSARTQASSLSALLQFRPDECCCGNFSVHWRIFSSSLGLNLLGANSKPSPQQLRQPKKSPDISKCPRGRGAKSPLRENYWYKLSTKCFIAYLCIYVHISTIGHDRHFSKFD